MVPPTKPQMEDQLIGQDTSFVEVVTQASSATMSRVSMTSPITPHSEMEEKRQYMVVVTTLIRRLNLEMTGVILGDTVTTLPGGSAFWNPHMAAVLLGRAINHQGTNVKELDAE